MLPLPRDEYSLLRLPEFFLFDPPLSPIYRNRPTWNVLAAPSVIARGHETIPDAGQNIISFAVWRSHS